MTMSKKYHAKQSVYLTADYGPEVELTMTVDFTVTDHLPQTMTDPEELPTVEDIEIKLFHGENALTVPSWMDEGYSDSLEFKDWLLDEAAEQHIAAKEDAADQRREMMQEERL